VAFPIVLPVTSRDCGFPFSGLAGRATEGQVGAILRKLRPAPQGRPLLHRQARPGLRRQGSLRNPLLLLLHFDRRRKHACIQGCVDLCFRVCAFGRQEHLLDQELKAKYGYCLKDLNNMPPRIAPENITPNSSRDSKTGMATQAQSVHVRFKEDTKVDAKVTQVSS